MSSKGKKKESEAAPSPDWIYGIHAIQGALEERAAEIGELIVVEGAKGRLAGLVRAARDEGVLVRYRPRDFFDRQVPDKPHQCALARVRDFAYADADELIQPPTEGCGPLLLLVGVQDPGNVGALIRSAKAFGASGVLLSRRDSSGVTAVASKAAAGAAAQIPIAQVHVQQAIKALRDAGWWLLGLDINGEPIEQFDLQRPTVFVLGAEGKGLKPSVQKHCDACLRIPMVEGWDSLNVSVSGGVALYEWRRQRPLL